MTGSPVLRALALGAAVLFAAGIAQVAVDEPARMDFVAQYAAAHLVLSGHGAAILDPEAILAAERAAAPSRVTLLPFVQVPAVALLLAPIAVLSFDDAFRLMALVDAGIIGLSLALLRPRGLDRWTAALLLVAPPSALAVAQGQISPLVLLLVALALRSGPRVGGVALGLSLIRPQTAPLIVLGAVLDPARRWWAVAGSLIVVAVSGLVVGPDGVARYMGGLAEAFGWSVTGERGLAASIGWTGVALMVGAGWPGLGLSILSLVVGAVVVARTDASRRPGVAALWSLLASPHALLHDAVLAYPAVVALASRRAAWDAASVIAWSVHVLVAPVGVLWSFALAIVHRGR